MKRRPSAAGGAIAAVVAIAAVWWWLGREGARSEPPPAADMSLVAKPVKPQRAPLIGEDRPAVPMPERPPVDHAALRVAYDRAMLEGRRPGEAAFRLSIDKFMEYNAEFAKAKAVKEGLTVPEIAELTYLGFLVLAMQPPEIEAVIGRPLSSDEQERLSQLGEGHNQEFTELMQELVARGAPEAERWELIRATETSYKQQLFEITGLTDETFDDLLAGDLARTGAAIEAEYPETIEPRPYVDEDRPRPDEPPPPL